MPSWLHVLFGTMAAIVIAAAATEAYLKRNRHRPLARMRPRNKETGGEMGLESRPAGSKGSAPQKTGAPAQDKDTKDDRRENPYR